MVPKTELTLRDTCVNLIEFRLCFICNGVLPSFLQVTFKPGMNCTSYAIMI